jgi:NhaP-type Na+/H+ or K+/H+ antiporter
MSIFIYKWLKNAVFRRGLNRRPDLFFQTEILVVVLFPYIAWMLAEAAHLSGIVSILFCGAYVKRLFFIPWYAILQ